MKRTTKYIAVAALSLGVSSLFAQDDVYYNPNSNKGTTQPTQTDYQQQYETTTPDPTPASNASDYDYKRDGYTATDPNQYSSSKNGNNNSHQATDGYYDDDYYFDDFSYSGRLNRFYQPHRGLGYWNNFYDPFYWNRPTIIVQTSYYNPWWSNWRYNMCNVQPWRCQLYSYGNSWGGGFNNGWGGGWNSGYGGYGYGGGYGGYGGGWNYGYGGGWGGGWNNGWGGNSYYNGYQAGYYNGYYNGGYNNGYYGGYNNGYGDYSQQQNYSYYGPRKQSGAAGGNTTDGQIKRAEGRAGKTDETDIPREGLVKPIGGRATGTTTPVMQSNPTRPAGVETPTRNGNTGVASPGQIPQGTTKQPTQTDLRPSAPEPQQIDARPSTTRPIDTRPQSTEPRQIESRPSNQQQFETRPQPTAPRKMESRPSNQQQFETRPQPTAPRQMESRPAPSRFESSPRPSQGSGNGGGNFSAPNPSNGGGSRSPGRVR